MLRLRAAAELSILHVRARLKRDAVQAYLAGQQSAGILLTEQRDELGRMVMKLLSRRQAEARP